MKTLLLALLLSMACADGAVLLSGRQTLAGKMVLAARAEVQSPGLIFSTPEYFSGWPSNTTTVTRLTNSPAYALQIESPDLLVTVDTDGSVRFTVEGVGGILVSNWGGFVFPVCDVGSGSVAVTVTGHSTGYGTGSAVINSIASFIEGNCDPNDPPPDWTPGDGGAFTPISKLWITIYIHTIPDSGSAGLLGWQTFFNSQ